MKLITRYLAVLVVAVSSFGVAQSVEDVQVFSTTLSAQECRGLEDDTPIVREKIVVITDKDECIIVLSSRGSHEDYSLTMSSDEIALFRRGLTQLFWVHVGSDTMQHYPLRTKVPLFEKVRDGPNGIWI